MTDEQRTAVRKKIENIWYYYKWYIIIGTIMAAFTVYACVQCAQRKENDLNIIFVTGSDNTAFTDGTCDEIRYFIRREYASDVNNDGEVNVSYVSYRVGTEAQKTDPTVQQALTTSLIDGERFLIICDETGYKHLKAIGGDTELNLLEPLTGTIPDEYVSDAYCVSLSGTKLGELETINEIGDEKELFACLRVFTGSSAEKDKKAEARFDCAKNVLNAILEDRKDKTDETEDVSSADGDTADSESAG